MLKLIVAVALAGTALAPLAAREPGSRQTREFIQAAGQSDQFEILEGQTALTESKDPRVLDFAQRMIADHSQTSAALAQATSRSGLPPPPKAISEDQAHLLSALQGLRGKEFDKAYFRDQALAHRSALTVEQVYATSGDDAAVRHAASSATPVIASHLAMAEQMSVKLGGQ
jgi:putative membrane protein